MYSPEIKPDKVKALYQLVITGKRMTVLVDEALEKFLKEQAPTTKDSERR
jgi:hypothetical protein